MRVRAARCDERLHQPRPEDWLLLEWAQGQQERTRPVKAALPSDAHCLRAVLMDSDRRSAEFERVEVVDTVHRRRWWENEKLKIVVESLQASGRGDGATIRHRAYCCALAAVVFAPSRRTRPGNKLALWQSGWFRTRG